MVLQVPRGPKVWHCGDVDPRRTVMAGAEYARKNVIGQAGYKWLVIFWYAGPVGRMVCGKEGIEKSVEPALAYEADIADFHGTRQPRRIGLPQSMSVRRILVRKPPSKDVEVCHWPWEGKGYFQLTADEKLMDTVLTRVHTFGRVFLRQVKSSSVQVSWTLTAESYVQSHAPKKERTQ